MFKVTIEQLSENGSETGKVIVGVMTIKNAQDEVYENDFNIVASEFSIEASNGSPATTTEVNSTEIKVKDHPPNRSVFGLVAKAARLVAGNLDRRIDRRR